MRSNWRWRHFQLSQTFYDSLLVVILESTKMVGSLNSFAFYERLQKFILKGEIPDCRSERRKMNRSSSNFTIKDDRLFYTGPTKQYFRLVVLSEEEKWSVLAECHNNPGTGNHCGIRGTQNRVIAGYYWSTLIDDVKEWVRSCHRCQLNDPIKTVVPVLHSIKVKEAWEVLGLDLIGPLPETSSSNKYVLTMTDLYTKWVIAEPMQSKTAHEVAAIITTKLYSFGMVRKIITDQGKEFVNKLNDSIFSALKIKHAVSSAYHPQTNGQDERTNQNIKRTLRKYVNDNHNDWDLHRHAVVYGINTAKQHSTRHSPYFLLFHRQPRLPEVMNACPMGDDFELADPEDDIETRVNEMKRLNDTVLSNIERAQSRQQKSFQSRKRKFVRACSIEAGDEVLLSGDPKKMRAGDTLTSLHQGPYTVANVSSKGVASIVKGSVCKRTNVSRLRTFYRLKSVPNERHCLEDHTYTTFQWQMDHPYACSGAKWEKVLSPIQNELLKYVLEENRPPRELIAKEGKICLTREDFRSLGCSQFMESNIGNACLKVVEEVAQRHGKSVHIMDLYVVPTWKNQNVDPVMVLPFFSQQSSRDSCGVYMLMHALSICTSCPLTFTEEDVPLIRQWWCINLMERFCLEGHGQRFAFWTEEASLLLQGTLEPVFRVSKLTTSRRVVDDEEIDKVQEPTIVRDLNTAWCWVQKHRHLFRGEVTELAFLKMNKDDQENALKNLLGDKVSEAKDDFLFIFYCQEDMEIFLSYCVDEQGLKVNAMF